MRRVRPVCPILLSLRSSEIPLCTWRDSTYGTLAQLLKERSTFSYVDSAASFSSNGVMAQKKCHFMDPTLNSSLFDFAYFIHDSHSFLDGIVSFKGNSEGYPGHVHGGLSSALMDDACGFLAFARTRHVVTTQLTVHYLKKVELATPYYIFCSFPEGASSLPAESSDMEVYGGIIEPTEGKVCVWAHASFRNLNVRSKL
jgi:hypothetical protein